MSEKKRRWFQIHLSTAIVLMIVAGVILRLNFISDIGIPSVIMRPSDNVNGYGWPIISCRRSQVIAWGTSFVTNYRWDIQGVIMNALFALALLSLIAWCLEWRERCRMTRTDIAKKS